MALQFKHVGKAGSGVSVGYGTNADEHGNMSEAAAVGAMGETDRDLHERSHASGQWLRDAGKPTTT